jgi:hypothetical protein
MKKGLDDETTLFGRAETLARHVGGKHVAEVLDIAVTCCVTHEISRAEA